MKDRNSFLPSAAGALCLVALTLNSFVPPAAAQGVAGSGSKTHLAGTAVQQTIAPAKLSEVYVNSLPNAVCTLRAHDDSSAVRNLTLYADDQGQVRFHAQADAETDNPATLDLQCETDSQVMDHNIQLRANTAIAEANATRAGATVRAPQAGRVRPALTGDPMQPSQEQLLTLGYPIRPDPVKSPEAYTTWLGMVTKETTVIDAKTAPQPGRFHAATSPSPINPVLPNVGASSNWSGFVLYRDARVADPFPPAPYNSVSGEWVVPAVSGEPNIQDDSAFWVGMDGWGTPDVAQDGTEQQVFTLSIFGAHFTISNYYAWVEFYPLPEQRITNLTVSPGDFIVGQVWVGDGINAVCFLQNLTTGVSTTLFVAPPPGTTFSGATAEWIMERPTVNGVLPDLANYRAAQMFNAFAERLDGTVVHPSGNSDSLNLTMENSSGGLISIVTRMSDTAMVFSWVGFK